MDYAKMLGGMAGNMSQNKTQTTNPEAAAMLADVGVALDENDKQRDASYRDAFTNYMEGANQANAQREMAAGAAANAAANSAGPPTGGVAPQVSAQQALQARMAQSAMGQGAGNMGAPGPSRALQNVQVDPNTGLAGATAQVTPAQLQQAQAGATQYGAPVGYPQMPAMPGADMSDAAMQAAFLRSRGML